MNSSTAKEAAAAIAAAAAAAAAEEELEEVEVKGGSSVLLFPSPLPEAAAAADAATPPLAFWPRFRGISGFDALGELSDALAFPALTQGATKAAEEGEETRERRGEIIVRGGGRALAIGGSNRLFFFFPSLFFLRFSCFPVSLFLISRSRDKSTLFYLHFFFGIASPPPVCARKQLFRCALLGKKANRKNKKTHETNDFSFLFFFS
jgi:hypothetical protein